MYQKLTLVGHVGTKEDLKYTPTGTAVLRFSLAATSGYGEHKRTMWVFVSTFGKSAEFCERYVHVGNLLLVEGEIKPDETGNPRMYTNKNGKTSTSYEMIGREIKLMPSKAPKEDTTEDDKFDDAFPF